MKTKIKTKMKTKIKTKINKTFKLQKVNCSPKPKNEINNFSCYTTKNLIKLRNFWNARHPDIIIKSNSPKEIHTILSKYLNNICNTELCWLKQKEFNNLIPEIQNSFAPNAPKEWANNPNEWLSSLDILNVMKQYEKAYKCFNFIGPTPIDFDKKLYGKCVWDELCNFNIQKFIKNGITKIGVIFNTDTHDKPGQHWISLFINIKKKKIFFFDSNGDIPPKEIITLVERIQNQGSKFKINFKFDSNQGVEHQYGNTECGIYSLFFIVHMLEDKITENYLKTHILKDEYMQKFRKIYFN